MRMSSKMPESDEDNPTCATCLQLYENSKFLHCHHTYREGCLEKMQKQFKIVCPECRAEANIPPVGVAKGVYTKLFYQQASCWTRFFLKKVNVGKKVECGKFDGCEHSSANHAVSCTTAARRTVNMTSSYCLKWNPSKITLQLASQRMILQKKWVYDQYIFEEWTSNHWINQPLIRIASGQNLSMHLSYIALCICENMFGHIQ